MESFIIKLSIMLVPGLMAITCHEVSHGFVAKIFGDNTASRIESFYGDIELKRAQVHLPALPLLQHVQCPHPSYIGPDIGVPRVRRKQHEGHFEGRR